MRTAGSGARRSRAAGAETGARAGSDAESAARVRAGGVLETDERGSRTVTEPRRAKPLRKARPQTGTRSRPRRVATGRPARRQRTPFVLLVVGLLCGGLVTLLLLNVVLGQDAMTASNLVDEISTARQQNEDLQRRVEENMTPDKIAERAEDLDMRRDWDRVSPYSGEAGPAR